MPDAKPGVRILVVHPRDIAAPTLGGIQTFLLDFIKMSPPDFEITVAGVSSDLRKRPIGRRIRVTVDGRHATLLPLAPAGGVTRDPIRLTEMAAAQVRLRREMIRADTILQVHRPYRSSLLAGHRGPRVQFVHVDIRDWPGPSAWSHLRGMYREFSDGALERMARVFVVNEPGAELLRSEHPRIADRIDFLPGWYDESIFRAPLRGEREELRRAVLEQLGLDQYVADRLILWAGRLEPIKDPELAVAGFAGLIRSSEMPARLLIAGQGTMAGAIEKQALDLGVAERVHLLGDRPREELARIMRACDALLLTARAEGGGPRVVLEALASGLPVVAAPVGEVRRTVEHRANGWLLDDRSPGAVAQGLRWVLEEGHDALAGAAVANVRPFTARNVLAQLYETYRQLAANGARS